jgi:hypothetical protein
VSQATKEQRAALELTLAPEAAGLVRPTLVAACAFALADMLLQQGLREETKQALATAYAAGQHGDAKGGVVSREVALKRARRHRPGRWHARRGGAALLPPLCARKPPA